MTRSRAFPCGGESRSIFTSNAPAARQYWHISRPSRRLATASSFSRPLVGRRLHLPQRRFQAIDEPLVHRLFLLAAIRAAGQDERLVAFRPRHQLHLHAFLDFAPVLARQILLELPQHRLGRAHDVLAAALAQELQVLLADHPAVHHPDAVGAAVLLLHRLDDLFHRGRVVAVAGEHLVTQGNPVGGDHQADADLQAIGAAVARVAPFRQAVGRALRPRNTCSSRRTTAGRTPDRTAFPAAP